MRKIHNPYTMVEGYNCFACSPTNNHGLKMEFFDEGDCIICIFEPSCQHQGYINILHGGIQTTMMDEIASWYIQTKLNTAGVTVKMNIRFVKPLLISKGKVKIIGRLLKANRRVVTIDSKIYNSDDVLCSEGEIIYKVFSSEIAREKLYYPGMEAF